MNRALAEPSERAQPGKCFLCMSIISVQEAGKGILKVCWTSSRVESKRLKFSERSCLNK